MKRSLIALLALLGLFACAGGEYILVDDNGIDFDNGFDDDDFDDLFD